MSPREDRFSSSQAGRGADEQARRAASRVEKLKAQLESAQRQQQAWEAGGEGERLVAGVLRQACWPALHDQPWPGRERANIDHIALSSSGIWVIDAKHWSGDVGVRQGVLRQNGYHRTEYLRKARAAAEAIGGVLPPESPPVAPIICLTKSGREMPAHLVEGVVVVGLDQLCGVLGPAPVDYEAMPNLLSGVRRALDRGSPAPTRTMPAPPQTHVQHPASPRASSTARSVPSMARGSRTESFRYASWGLRVRATLFDWILLTLPFAASRVLSQGGELDLLAGWVWLGLVLVLAWTNGRGGSPGKRLARIRVVRARDGSRLGGPVGVLRGLVLVLMAPATAGILFLASVLWPLVDWRKQALHDKVVGSVVVKG